MRIHEYQAKALMAQFGIPVPKGGVATTASEARNIAAQLGDRVVIKAQVYAGGRGQVGGVKIAGTPEEAEIRAGELLGSRLVTQQTTPKGLPVRKVLVEEAIDIRRELYLGLVIDGANGLPVMMASEAGGMEIEEVARQSPEKVLKSYIDPPTSFRTFHGGKLAYGLNLKSEEIRPAIELMGNVYRVFVAKDCSLAEINPLIITTEGKLLALDAKLNFDDNAMFRHPDLEELRDWEQEDPVEARAAQLGVRNFVKLDGNIGCLINGAGLTMAIMDLLTEMGGRPANFYDIGPDPVSETIVKAFALIVADPNVKVLLVDVFAGMGKGDAYARGIVDGYRATNCRLPLVAKIVGTNAKEGRCILAESGIDYYEASDIYDEAKQAVKIAGRFQGATCEHSG